MFGSSLTTIGYCPERNVSSRSRSLLLGGFFSSVGDRNRTSMERGDRCVASGFTETGVARVEVNRTASRGLIGRS